MAIPKTQAKTSTGSPVKEKIKPLGPGIPPAPVKAEPLKRKAPDLSKRPATPRHNITLYAGSKSYETAHPSRAGANGVFSEQLAGNLAKGKSIQSAFDPLANKNISPHKDPALTQTPNQYGPNMDKPFDKGIAVLINGMPQNDSDRKSFEADRTLMTKKFGEMGFDVLPANNWGEFQSQMKNAKALGEKRENDALLVHYAGHGDLATNPEQYKSALGASASPIFTSAGRSIWNKEETPSLEGVLPFGHTPNGATPKPNYIHENDFMKEIQATSKAFDHTGVILDSCHAGAFGESTESTTDTERIPIDPDYLYTSRSGRR